MNSVDYFNEDRESLWDNLKFLMIYLVVLGHILQHFKNDDAVIGGVLFFIYLFHMPVFLFMSGLFSKKAVQKKQTGKIVFYLGLYLFIKVSFALADSIKTGAVKFHFFWDTTPAWYAFSMAVFLAVVMVLHGKINDKGLLILSLFLGIAAGCDNHLGNHFVSMRSAVFFPFFVMGYMTDRDKIVKTLKKKQICIGAAIFLIVALILCLMFSDKLLPYLDFIKGKTTYVKVGLEGPEGLLLRLLYYLIVPLFIASFIALTPTGNSLFTITGQNTLTIYALHPVILRLFFEVYGGKSLINQLWQGYILQVAILSALLLVLLLTPVPFQKLANRITKT